MAFVEVVKVTADVLVTEVEESGAVKLVEVALIVNVIVGSTVAFTVNSSLAIIAIAKLPESP